MLHCGFSIRLQSRIIEGIGRPDGWGPLTCFTKVKDGRSWFVWICAARKLDRFLLRDFRTTLIAWSGFNQHFCTLVILLCPWIRRLTMIICAWWLRTSSKFGRQEYEELHMNNKTLGHWKLLSRCRFLKGRSSCRSEKCADCPTVKRLTLSGNEKIICTYNSHRPGSSGKVMSVCERGPLPLHGRSFRFCTKIMAVNERGTLFDWQFDKSQIFFFGYHENLYSLLHPRMSLFFVCRV